MSYPQVCKALGVSFKRGFGLIRDTGIDLEDIKARFNDYFGSITDFNEEVPEELVGMDDEAARIDAALGIDSSTSGITLEEFIMMFENEGRFLVGLVSPKGDGHIAFVNCQRGRNFVVDTFNCLDFTVDSWMQIQKVLPKEDPRRYVYDKEKHCFVV